VSISNNRYLVNEYSTAYTKYSFGRNVGWYCRAIRSISRKSFKRVITGQWHVTVACTRSNKLLRFKPNKFRVMHKLQEVECAGWIRFCN
jgi:hypothetical protein